ncbi:MAG: TetR/AcrR family transcriptional regulator [Clostridia bacterium]
MNTTPKKQNNTLDYILNAAKAEFLEKGFRGASLRNIVKNANVTTGAFYGYFKSKEDLFDALVSEPADFIMREFNRIQTEFTYLTPDEQEAGMGKISKNSLIDWIDFIIDNSDVFKLILKSSEGTRYENFIHDTVTREVQATHDFIKTLNQNGKNIPCPDDNLAHILISGMFTAYFEIALHDMPKESAKKYVDDLSKFHIAGWAAIMGL